MRSFVVIALVILAVPDREDPSKKAVKPVEEQLLGEWLCVRAVQAGQDDPIRQRELTLIVEKDVIRVRENGKINSRDETGYKIDAAKKPITLDLTPKNMTDLKIPGILKLDGDDLVI